VLENLEALVFHQFGDHSKCAPRFCGYKRRPGEAYLHRSLPYKTSPSNPVLREQLEKIFEPVIAKASVYCVLGSSQACEHANRAVSLQAPKHLHYGESESLDFRVKASAACSTAGVTGQQRMLTPPRHLILPSHLSEVCVALH
jgi:hypothetical protein